MPLNKRKFDYKWIILAVCFMMVFVCLGFCSSTKSLYHNVISNALNIERTLLSFGDSARFIASAVINLFFGTLLYKYGVRKMTAFGFVTLIVSTLIYAFAVEIATALLPLVQGIWGAEVTTKPIILTIFYIAGALLGVGLSFTTTTMASTMLRRWFNKDIGKYTGIVFSANGVGGALAGQVLCNIIESETGFTFFGKHFMGYQTAYILTGIILLVFGIFVVALLKDPSDGPALPAGKKKARGATWSGVDIDTAKRSSYFYITIIVVFLTGFCLQGIYTTYKAHMSDIGMDKNYVYTLFSCFSLILTATKILVGFIYDRFYLKAVMLVCMGSAVIAFISLAAMVPGALGNVLGVVFAVLFALALPLETLVIPLIANDLFGSKNYDRFLGLLLAANYSGYALGSPFIDLFHDFGGSYRPGLFLLSGIMVTALVLILFAIKKAYAFKQQFIAAETTEKSNSV